MRMIGLVWVVAALGLVTASGAAALDQGQKAPAFKLQDQFGKTWDLAAQKGRVVVIVAADRDSGRAMDPWVSNLKSTYGSRITLVGLLDLHSIPGLFRGIAKSRIRKETSDPLALDFGGQIAKAYGVSSKLPTVVVIDREGIVRSAQTLAHTPDVFKVTAAAIDQALSARS